MSSPFSATYRRWRWIASEYHCSAASTCSASRGTRLMASSDNWKRSILLSTQHIERRCCGALFLVAAHVKRVVVVTSIGEPMNHRRITMEGKDHRCLGRKDLVIVLVGQPVWMLGGRLQRHQVYYVDHANLRSGASRAAASRRQRLQRRHVARAGNHHIRLALVVRGPLPNTQSLVQ